MHQVIADYEHTTYTTPFPSARMAMIHARAAEAEGASVLVLDPHGHPLHITEDHP